jgi:hypothetical protein
VPEHFTYLCYICEPGCDYSAKSRVVSFPTRTFGLWNSVVEFIGNRFCFGWITGFEPGVYYIESTGSNSLQRFPCAQIDW